MIVVANAFGKGIEQVGLARVLGDLIAAPPAGSCARRGRALRFAAVSGSGNGQHAKSLRVLPRPAETLGTDPASVGGASWASRAPRAGRCPPSPRSRSCAPRSAARSRGNWSDRRPRRSSSADRGGDSADGGVGVTNLLFRTQPIHDPLGRARPFVSFSRYCLNCSISCSVTQRFQSFTYSTNSDIALRE